MPRAPANENRYRDLLIAHLRERPLREVLFFANPRRFDLLENNIGRLLGEPGARVLNVASGPFALEYYLDGRAAHVQSVDVDPALAPLHAALLADGLIENSSYAEADVMSYEPDGLFDIVIINDLFYARHVDFYAIFDRYRRHVRPGGVLYFDILDERAGALWQAFGKDSRYRRYCLDSVRTTLRQAGFSIEAEAPSPGIKGGLDMAARKLLWRGFGIANNLIFVSRRKSVAAGMVAAIMGIVGFGAHDSRGPAALPQPIVSTSA